LGSSNSKKLKNFLLLDLGAHWGESLRYFANLLPDSNQWDIISVEASRLNFCKLEKNYIDYKSSFKSIKLLNAFASQSDENVAFYEYTDEFHSAGSTFSKYKFDFNSRKKPEYQNLRHNILQPEIFNVIRFYEENIEFYDLLDIKLDIEGTEYEILPKLIPILNPNKTKNLYIEFHNERVGVNAEVDQKIISEIKELGINYIERN
jgi:FkbM family methyltransferase